jgi:hypothetical protein
MSSSVKESDSRRKKEKTRIPDMTSDTDETAGPPISTETKKGSLDGTEERFKCNYADQIRGKGSLETETQNFDPIVRREDEKKER